MSEHASHRRSSRVGFYSVSVMTLLLCGLLARVVQLQVRPSEELREYLRPRVGVRSELPQRGDILDRRGRVLSATRFGWRVYVDPVELPKEPSAVIVGLAGALGLPEEQVGERILSRMSENARRTPEAPATVQPTPGQVVAELIGWDDARVDPTLAAGAVEEVDENAKKPIRYLPIGGVIEDEVAEKVRALKLAGVHMERRPIREYPGGSEVASILGKVGFDGQGLIGSERVLDRRLTGEAGKVSYVRDSAGRPLWIEPEQIRPATPGHDVAISIDLELQRIACEELMRGVEEYNAAGGRLVCLDPNTGEILAMADIVRPVAEAVGYPWIDKSVRKGGHEAPVPAPAVGGVRFVTLKADPGRAIHPALARNRCVEDVYEPGSTFKPFVWSTVTDLGLARIDEVFETGHTTWFTSYGRPISDVTKRDQMTWAEVLVNSSNIGMVKVGERLSFKQLHDAVARFGFGQRTNIGLSGESPGIVTPMSRWSKYTHTSVCFGHEVSVTPLQMVRAFSAFAREGDLAGTLPTLRMTAVTDAEPANRVLYRVLPADVAVLTRETMRGVTGAMEAKLDAREKTTHAWNYEIFGKSGTAEIPLGKAPTGKRRPVGSSGYFDGQYNSSFIAGGPVERPRLVTLVVIDDPGPELARKKLHYGASTAGPVVRRFMERGLAYLGVAPAPRVAPGGEARPALTGPARSTALNNAGE
ncbi:MAG: penicillin-binding protein 2 [Phycisphaerae bacterium]|nr:penicillin-binding protein 2 [Phycisphaerae bacterium]